jgi:hypothetical protein
MDITLPYIPDALVIVDDMLGKLPKLRYSDDDVHDAVEFLDLAEDNYLKNTGEIGPLGKPIMDLVQWIMRLYNCWHRGRPRVECFNNAPKKP